LDPVFRRRVTQPEGGRMMTKQAEAAETDINAIIRRHRQMGAPFPTEGGTYGDFSTGLDFHASLNRVREAELTFNLLPAEVREFCSNDPGRFLDLVGDPAKREELVKLGLVEAAIPNGMKPSPEPAPSPAPSPVAGGNPPLAGGVPNP